MTQREVKNIKQLSFLALDAKIIADKYFPQESRERSVLLSFHNACEHINDLRCCLEATQKQIDEIRAIPLPDDFDVIWSALSFESLAKEFAGQFGEESKIATALKSSSEVLRLWYRWYSSVKKLLEISAAIRLDVMDKQGDA